MLFSILISTIAPSAQYIIAGEDIIAGEAKKQIDNISGVAPHVVI